MILANISSTSLGHIAYDVHRKLWLHAKFKVILGKRFSKNQPQEIKFKETFSFVGIILGTELLQNRSYLMFLR